jgi:hypothetical protein
MEAGSTTAHGRFNQLFRASTPKIADSEIRGLIKKYPPPPNIQSILTKIQSDIAALGENPTESRKLLKKKLAEVLSKKLNISIDASANLASQKRHFVESMAVGEVEKVAL